MADPPRERIRLIKQLFNYSNSVSSMAVRMHCIGDGSLSASVVFLLLSFVIHIHYYASTTTSAEAPAYPYIKLTTIGIAQAPLPPNPYKNLTNCTSRGRCNPTVAPLHNDSISYGQEAISYGQVAKNLTSIGGTFVLGFFERRRKTYLGIWYGTNVTSDGDVIVVWVGNRDAPMPLQDQGPSAYSIRISTDGNAEVFDSNDAESSPYYWSTNSSTMLSSVNNSVLLLSDTGNLILEDRGSKLGGVWQSFQSPTDTFLPGMDIAGVKLVSWKTPEDPAHGDYSFQKDSNSNATLIHNTSSHQPSTPYWNSTLSPLNDRLTSYFNKTTTKHTLTRVVTSSNGSVQLWELNQTGIIRKWKIIWAAPKDRCDLPDPCGNFGVCDAGNRIRCKCLPGYEPYEPDKWQAQDFSSGCSKTTTRCGATVTGLLLSLPMVKLPPDSSEIKDSNETQCKEECLNSCPCMAYSFNAIESTCQTWTKDLTHIQEEYSGIDSQTLYIHVNQLDIGSGSRTCDFCGTNVIPYPLSTSQTCGDPAYLSFQCNNTNGQVYFKPPSGKSYKVSLIDPESRKVVIQLGKVGTTSGTCNTTDINFTEFSLSNTSPFNVTSCSVAPPNGIQAVDVELSWKPPPPPACNSSKDCRDWNQTTCAADHMNGKNVCTCAKGFNWISLYMNCTKDHRHMPLSLKVGVATASGIVLLLLGSFLFILCLRRKRAIQRAGLVNQLKTDDDENIDIPFIDYQSILAATDNFSNSNKLGAGGFGPVYKGMLSDGTEVAVKRLSAASAQGIEEFRNEVILIAKLQHRNLVRVLGYCMKEDEKILIYEYMPNKCLSSYIFDHTTSTQLDWTKRLHIILGIARGLVYLHQDSRLRIIHRDLKPSNILLDEELNPKISDFGLARIVAGSEIATSTTKVVGTYGYMSPEYALHGYFSIKSDVYSFGIILLEVISGRRCTSLLQFDNILISLLGYAWTLWDQEKALELVDESIVDSCDSFEVTRCINVGLLCLQEDPSDRPTMAAVLLMLGGDTSLPRPNQPVFVARRPPLQTASSSLSSSKLGTSTSNVDLSATLEGR